MTSFEAGFHKYAEECGLSVDQTVHMFKRAMDYPGTQNMFKQLPEEQQEEHNENPHDLASLTEMLKQHVLHEAMDADTKKIQL